MILNKSIKNQVYLNDSVNGSQKEWTDQKKLNRLVQPEKSNFSTFPGWKGNKKDFGQTKGW